MEEVDRISWLIEQNKIEREKLKLKESEALEKKDRAIKDFNESGDSESERRVRVAIQKLNEIGQKLIDVRKKNKQLQKKRSIIIKNNKNKKEDSDTQISNHSVVRYLSRVKGVDFNSSSFNTSGSDGFGTSINCNTSGDLSDHEIISNLTTSGEINLDEIKSEIIDEEMSSIINSDELKGTSGTFTNSEGVRLVVKNGVVVTVLPKKEKKKKKKK